MSSGKPFPQWNNPKIELFHGTVHDAATAIERDGVHPALGRPNTDFGRGFYTTTWLEQARHWAVDVARRRGGRTSVVKLTLDRLALRSLRTLTFVRGTKNANDFWSFVEHCRNRSGEAPVTGEYYDVVYGPVAQRWGPDDYETFPDMDQISFHGATVRRTLQDREVCTVEVIE